MVGRYQILPYSQIVNLKQYTLSFFQKGLHEYTYNSRNAELTQFAFTDEIIKGDKIYPPITSLEEITQRNKEIFLPVTKFFTAYKELEIKNSAIISLNQGHTKITKVEYALSDQIYDGYAYGQINDDAINKRAILIIPGSGLNQSSAIVNNEQSNYHFGIINQFQDKETDTFVFIKPNQDVLAFHNGFKKLNLDHYVNWHLNKGGSFSSSYIVQSMAFTKYLQTKYKTVILVGLSQGGAAALLNAFQSEPDLAVISSGYSQINQQVESAGHNQIIIPGVSNLLDIDNLKTTISKMKTSFLFTWGLRERGTYRIEAEENYSCSKFKNIKNIKCIIFQGEHNFPLEEIQTFVKNRSDYELCLKN